jgi:prolipoprotein diacylglyceryl transferase
MILPGFIPSPPANGFHLGPLFLHAYGLSYVVGVTGAVLLTRELWRRDGGDPKLPQEIVLWAFPAGLIGGRIYFLITTPSQIPPHWWGPFAIWKGGLGSWGGIAAGVLAGVWLLRRRIDEQQVRRFLDDAAPGILFATSCVRVGNYFNQELFGKPTTLPWWLEISPANRPPGYTLFATFQPTFLYEIIFNLLFAAVLIWLVRRQPYPSGAVNSGRARGERSERRRAGGKLTRIRAPGVFALYVAGYSGYRIFEETIRIDYSNYVLGMRLNFWIALLMCLAGLLWFVAIQREWRVPFTRRRPPPPGPPAKRPASKRGRSAVARS